MTNILHPETITASAGSGGRQSRASATTISARNRNRAPASGGLVYFLPTLPAVLPTFVSHPWRSTN